MCCLVLIIAIPYSLVFLSILLRGFKGFKMQQPDYPDLSTSHHSSRTFTGCLSIGDPRPYTRLLHYVIHYYLALALNTFWPYSCLHPCNLLSLFLRYSHLEHSCCQTKVLWSAFFCLPRSHYMEFFATCTQISTGIWLLQASFEDSSVFSQLMN